MADDDSRSSSVSDASKRVDDIDHKLTYDILPFWDQIKNAGPACDARLANPQDQIANLSSQLGDQKSQAGDVASKVGSSS
jgi:hypothetical protein